MKRQSIILAIAFILILGWYINWRIAMRPHIKQIEQTITELNTRYKTPMYRATIEHGSIHAAGFPFSKSVVIDYPKLNMIYGTETYSIAADKLNLAFKDETQGRYALTMSPEVHALYAENGKTPENYDVSISQIPYAWLRVQDYKPNCTTDCKALPDATLKEFGFQLQGEIILNASLNGKTQTIAFRQPPFPAPIFIDIPENIARPASLFVGMLREALVFNTPQ